MNLTYVILFVFGGIAVFSALAIGIAILLRKDPIGQLSNNANAGALGSEDGADVYAAKGDGVYYISNRKRTAPATQGQVPQVNYNNYNYAQGGNQPPVQQPRLPAPNQVQPPAQVPPAPAAQPAVAPRPRLRTR